MKRKKRIIKIGDKIDRLTVIADTGKYSSNGEKIFLCKCECGTEKEVRSSSIGKNTKSCGCIKDILYREGTYIPAIRPGKLPQKNNTSGHVGVMQGNEKWVAKIGLYGRKYHLGTFDTYEEACKAREEAEQELFVPTLKRYEEKGLIYNN